MKKVLTFLAIVSLLFPPFASAQVMVSQGGTGTTTNPAGSFLVGSDSFKMRSTLGNLFWDFATNNLGIATSSPYAKLSVVGEIVSSFLTSTSTTATSTFANHISIGTDKEYRIGGNGVLTKKSNGAVILGDVSGNARGTNAIDVQSYRSADTQVASGPQSIAVGSENTASGAVTPSIAVGLGNVASGISSAAFGRYNTCSGGASTCYGSSNIVDAIDAASAFGVGLTNSSEKSVMFGRGTNFLMFRDPDSTTSDYPVTAYPAVGFGTTTPFGRFAIGLNNFPTSVPVFNIASSSTGVATTSVFTILGNGNTGVGTSSPFTNLSVTGNIHASGNITCGGTCGGGSGTVNSSTAGYNAYYASTGSAVSGTSTIFISTAERVGVGTLLPAVKFHSVINSGTISGAFERNTTSSGSSVVQIGSTNSLLETSTFSGIKNSSAGTLSLQTGSTVVGTEGTDRVYVLSTGNVGVASSTPWGLLSVNPSSIGTAPSFVVGSSTATHLVVANNGNVGIGTTSPYAKLSVAGQTVSGYFTATSTTASTFPYASSTALSTSGRLYSGDNLYVGSSGNTGKTISMFASGGTEVTASADTYFGFPVLSTTMIKNTQGRFLFDPLDSKAEFVVSGATTQFNIYNSSLAEYYLSISTNGSDVSTTELFGNVGVGTSSPWRKLSVAGTVAFNGLTSSATGNAVCITTSKDLTDSGGAACTPSSIQFKENVSTLLDKKAVETLMKLRPVEFDYKDKQPHETNHSYGLIAEEVEAVDKNLVDYKNDGGIFGLHFEKITGLLVSSMQNVIARVSGLEKKVEEQDKRIAELERIINERK